MLRIVQVFLNTIKPVLAGFLTRILYSGGSVSIGRNFKSDSIPRIIIDKSAKLVIGDGVQFRRNVEIRVHGNAVIYIGDNCRIDRGVRLLAANKAVIKLEKGVRVGLYTVFNGGDSVHIGEQSLISGFVYIQTSMHKYEGGGDIQKQGYNHAPIIIEKDSWLGTHVVVFPGVVLGEGTVVGSNAVVNKSFEKGSIIGGVPAKILKFRN